MRHEHRVLKPWKHTQTQKTHTHPSYTDILTHTRTTYTHGGTAGLCADGRTTHT